MKRTRHLGLGSDPATASTTTIDATPAPSTTLLTVGIAGVVGIVGFFIGKNMKGK